MQPEELVGIWSSEGEKLVFFPDKSGAIDYFNVVFAGRTEFEWTITDEGRVKIVPSPWPHCHQESVAVSIDEVPGRSVLRIEFDYPGNSELGYEAGHTRLDYSRSRQRLENYIPPSTPTLSIAERLRLSHGTIFEHIIEDPDPEASFEERFWVFQSDSVSTFYDDLKSCLREAIPCKEFMRDVVSRSPIEFVRLLASGYPIGAPVIPHEYPDPVAVLRPPEKYLDIRIRATSLTFCEERPYGLHNRTHKFGKVMRTQFDFETFEIRSRRIADHL